MPYVHGTPMSLPNIFRVQAHAMRVLRDKLPQIVDAVEPGGSGDMYAGLTTEERDALAEVTRMGFPPRAWFDAERICLRYTTIWAGLFDHMVRWTPATSRISGRFPGYLGANPPTRSSRRTSSTRRTVTKPVMAPEATALGLPLPLPWTSAQSTTCPVAFRLEELPDGDMTGPCCVHEWQRRGRQRLDLGRRATASDDGFGEAHFDALRGVAAGDEVLLDNSSTSPSRPTTATRCRRTTSPSGTSSAPRASRSTRSDPSSSARATCATAAPGSRADASTAR